MPDGREDRFTGVAFASGRPRPLFIGMIHLRPLPGSPRCRGGLEEIVGAAVEDLEQLVRGGADGAIVENLGDAPFFPGPVPPVTVAAMTAVTAVLRAQAPEDFLMGVNVLRNDAASALSIAHVTGASFIRINVHAGAAVADQGILQGLAHETLRLRSFLGARVSILADVAVKHARPLSPGPVEDEAIDLVERGLADGLLVTGSRTGAPVDRAILSSVRRTLPSVPLLAASGVDADSVRELRPHCDGFIIGTALKVDGRIDRERVRGIANLIRRGRI